MKDGLLVLRSNLVDNIINPLLLLLFAVGLLVFVFGVVEFIYGLNTNSEAKDNGKRHMLWGLIGMFIMAVAYPIVLIIINAVGGNVVR